MDDSGLRCVEEMTFGVTHNGGKKTGKTLGIKGKKGGYIMSWNVSMKIWYDE